MCLSHTAPPLPGTLEISESHDPGKKEYKRDQMPGGGCCCACWPRVLWPQAGVFGCWTRGFWTLIKNPNQYRNWYVSITCVGMFLCTLTSLAEDRCWSSVTHLPLSLSDKLKPNNSRVCCSIAAALHQKKLQLRRSKSSQIGHFLIQKCKGSARI